MAKKPRLTLQPYPRTPEGLLDDNALVGHSRAITDAELKALIRDAIEAAARKSSRAILSIGEQATAEEILATYVREGRALFRYFHKYVSDPAATAHQLRGKHYRDVGLDQFRNRTLQKERMNSGWRYQFLAVYAARATGRFESVSDIGTAEGDFNAIVPFSDRVRHSQPLRLYVSVKNRANTMGGQDWPKAIQALENYANADKNANGPYCCVFGIAMEPGSRSIKRHKTDGQPYSSNTEVWYSDFFWPFFSAHSYEEIMTFVLDVLLEVNESNPMLIEIAPPPELLDSFGEECAAAGLLNENGCFNDPYRLVRFFVQPIPRRSRKK
jgi:hypothetical protein